jgi:hypothetical protein
LHGLHNDAALVVEMLVGGVEDQVRGVVESRTGCRSAGLSLGNGNCSTEGKIMAA